MVKRRASAKQLAWRRTFAARYGKRRSAEAPARSYRSAEAPSRSWSKMARRKSYRRSSGFGLGGLKPTLGKVFMGMGVAALVGGPIGALGGFFIGGPIAAAGAFFAPQIQSTVGGITGSAGAMIGQRSYSGTL